MIFYQLLRIGIRKFCNLKSKIIYKSSSETTTLQCSPIKPSQHEHLSNRDRSINGLHSAFANIQISKITSLKTSKLQLNSVLKQLILCFTSKTFSSQVFALLKPNGSRYGKKQRLPVSSDIKVMYSGLY